MRQRSPGRRASAAVLCALALLGCGCATRAAWVHDAQSGFTLALPADWESAYEASMTAYRDPGHPEYTFWIAGGEVERTDRNEDMFRPGGALPLLDELLAGNPVAPQIHRHEALGPDRALAFYRVTRFVADGQSQYAWTLVDTSHGRLHIGVFTFSVVEAGADPERTESLLLSLWRAIAALEIDPPDDEASSSGRIRSGAGPTPPSA